MLVFILAAAGIREKRLTASGKYLLVSGGLQKWRFSVNRSAGANSIADWKIDH
ncbi:MAG: hypothetical protein ACOY81_01000 [Bacillota bacterium]|uniref:hypothetical protein n=1 Tax=Desulfurispora thermophila TaxID=265470 RepID=UPI0003A9E35D|nr:hypothetical protein [Desulfurispora thermophila]